MLFFYKTFSQDISPVLPSIFSQLRARIPVRFYKASFVIFRNNLFFLSSVFGDLLGIHFLYSHWYRQQQLTLFSGKDRYSRKRILSTLLGVNRVLRITRLYLLQFGQRRVCNRNTVWLTESLWSLLHFEKHSGWFRPLYGSSLRYTYRHLHTSEFFNLGLMLVQPNYYLFIYLLANPYFWTLLQQTLNSNYRT